MRSGKAFRRTRIALVVLVLAGILIGLFSGSVLRAVGRFPVRSDAAKASDAVVVLNTGVEYYPRLMEAARLYRQGLVPKVVLNGNRKTDTLRDLEKRGYRACCPWFENRLRVLELFRVPREDVLCIGAEDAYDTVSEAETVGGLLLDSGVSRVIITTSKSHTRRAHVIWSRMYKNRLAVQTVPAQKDPYDPESWWRSGRQIRWVMAEYGAWLFYAWKSWMGGNRGAGEEKNVPSVSIDWGSMPAGG